MPGVRLDHCVIHVSDWERSNAFYRDVLGAEIVPVGDGFSYRFGPQQLNVHGPGIEAGPVARVPVPPGGSDLCFEWPGPVDGAEEHLRRHGVEVELGPVERHGAGARGPASTSATLTGRSSSSSRIGQIERLEKRLKEDPVADVEHISRKGSGVPVSWFPVPEESELPEGLRGLFRKARESVGFVPNVFRAYSFRPERLSAWFAHYRQLHEPTANLDAAEREMIAVAVSMANGCLYCLVAHGAALREALGDPILADRITLDHRRAGLDERRTAILDFAVKITERPLECDPLDLERLKGFGLSEEEVWDVVEIASMYNFTNRMSLACGMIPNEEYHALAR